MIDTSARVMVGAGSANRALEIQATLLPERQHEVRWYARGVGLVKQQGPGGLVELTDVY